MSETLDIENILQYLTIDEKIAMLSGDGMWHTVRAGEVERVRMSDGPNGLRMVEGASALPATCFPTASMLANSWDTRLVERVGAAIGTEATAAGVHLLLAPGLNIKRHPRGGRNFEYFSEDPYLSGTLGAAYVRGVQSTGVGACIKHFAANNQETLRMYTDAIVDDRALHEIYLKPFEIALSAKPKAVMCAYNKLNGEYCSQNKYLLTDVLRDEFGFEGLVVSDWGAVRDRAKALAAGLDLEMPDSLGLSAPVLKNALESGAITEADIDRSLRRILELFDDVYLEANGDFDPDAHDALAHEAAVASVVLLKNDNKILPLTRDKKIAVVGELAQSCPIQGGGSSHVSAIRNVSPLDMFMRFGIEVAYFSGYSSDKEENDRRFEETVEGAKDCDVVVVYAGTPAPSEGVDRKDIALPPEQDRLITALATAGHKVVVVLIAPGAVAMPWIKRVSAVLYGGLNGQAGARAVLETLYGRYNPCGRLSETFPIDEDELGDDFGTRRTLYRESLFVGYRYYDAIERRVLFPFGYGLSYSEIVYDDMKIARDRDDYNKFTVSVTVSNKSMRDAYEVVQLYISDRTGKILSPQKQLVRYAKLLVEGESSATAVFELSEKDFAFYDTKARKYRVCDGQYGILAASSAADIKFAKSVHVRGDFNDKLPAPEAYKMPLREKITDENFRELFGGEFPEEAPLPAKGTFTLDCSLDDMKNSLGAKLVIRAIKRNAKSTTLPGSVDRDALLAFSMNAPLSAVAIMSDGTMTPDMAQGIVDMANGKLFKGLAKLIKKQKDRA